VVARFSTDEIPILRLSATSNLSPGDFYQLLDDRVAPIMSNVSGVGSVTLIGAQQREVQVVMDNDKLKAYGMSATQVAQAWVPTAAPSPPVTWRGGLSPLHQPGCPRRHGG
jgi:HAE1 family hydrophobic/amphiphilic exporter-1